MTGNKILLTSSTYPYPMLPGNGSLTDVTGQRFTRGDGMFSLISHTHCFANHILAQNIDAPVTILEYPRWEDFTAEVDKGYAIIGISALPIHLGSVMRMCEYIRQHSPATKILMGCYAGLAFKTKYDREMQKRYVDEVVHGEGVRFLREYLGEDPDRPIRQMLLPKAGGSPKFITRFPKGAVAFLVSGLGCPGRCDFCSSTALFDHQRIEMLSPEDLVRHMCAYRENFPGVSHVFVIEEDHFRWPDYLLRVRDGWQNHPELSEQFDWFGFGSMDHIGQFARRHGWDAISEMGLGVLFIGVESKFMDDLKMRKRAKTDPREVFHRLHQMGIRTVGSWICGWDFHNHANVMEDLNYFVSLNPTYQQLTRLSPLPGTRLYEKLKEQGRLQDVPWEDVHFWSGAQKQLGLEDHETLNLIEHGYKLMNETWGPSMLRRLDVQLNGYRYCMQSSNPVLREHRSIFFKKQSGMIWSLLRAMHKFAANGEVRRKVQKVDQKYRAVIGEPTVTMEVLARTVETLATVYHAREIVDPSDGICKEEPFKRYVYDRTNGSNGDIPYTTQWPTKPSAKTRWAMIQEEIKYALLEKAIAGVRIGWRKRCDPVIDDCIYEMVRNRAFGFGL